MKYVIVSGSHRKKSQSEKVARYLQKRLQKLDEPSTVDLVSLGGNPIPFWDEEVWEKSQRWEALWTPISSRLREADAFIFIVPEWGGMAPPAFKNFLLLCSNELAHKPALLVAVSAGIGGSYPIVELRMSGYKNTQVSYLPEHLIIRKVEEVLNEDVVNSEHGEEQLRQRIEHSLRLLGIYGRAFQQIRATQEVELRRYPYGM